MKRHFANTVKKDSALKRYTEKLLFEMVNIIQVIFGKGTVKGQKRKKTPRLTCLSRSNQYFSSTYILEGS
jgi:hypothetical protein